MTIPQERRKELRRLAAGATAGPWEADHSEEDNSAVKVSGAEWGDGLAYSGRPADAEFIAASRQAIPDLLDALDAAEARLQAVRDVLDRAESQINHRPAYTWTGTRMDPIVNGADIRHALDGESMT